MTEFSVRIKYKKILWKNLKFFYDVPNSLLFAVRERKVGAIKNEVMMRYLSMSENGVVN